MSHAVLAVALNSALDVTYRVDEFCPGEVHRVRAHCVPGGKAVNVARTLEVLGHPVTVTGFVGGTNGEELRRMLVADHPDIDEQFVNIGDSTRRTVVVVNAAGVASGFWEEGPRVTVAEWERLLARVADLAATHPVTVVSGSLPREIPEDAYRLVVETAHSSGSHVVLDASGSDLWCALGANPELIKATEGELVAAVEAAGLKAETTEDVFEALIRAGARAVVSTRGVDGILAWTPTGRYRAAPSEVVSRGNSTGAGDAAAAAFARGIAEGYSWKAMIDDALALSAATVASEVAGSFAEDLYRKLRGHARVDEVS